jgi:hypothetical protein
MSRLEIEPSKTQMKVQEFLIAERKNLSSWIFIGKFCFFATSAIVVGGSLPILASGVFLFAETYVKPTNI